MFSSKSSNYWGEGSVEVSPSQAPGESGIRRLAKTKDRLVTQPLEGIDTMYDILAYAARTHGTRKAFGYRDIVGTVEEEKDVKKIVDGKETHEKKKWTYFQLSDFQYYSFLDVKNIVSEIARGLLALEVRKGEVVNVYAQTSPNWQFFAQACSMISTTMATAYDTLGEVGLEHSLNEPECRLVFTNADLLPLLTKVAPKVPTLRFVIYDGTPDAAVLDGIKAAREDLKVISLDELRELGRAQPAELAESRLPTKDDVACIMYTSGSTGAPKGVVIKHSNLIAAVGSVYVLFGHHLRVDDTYLAFLPLAHILEFVVELCFLFIGMEQGFGRVKTLTDVSVRNCTGDIREFRPTIMIAVPAVWELIRKGIMSQVNHGGALKKSVFNGAMSVKRANVPGLKDVVDSVVFSQGYGMTESCGMCAILPPEVMQYSSVGLPSPSVEIKMLDVPEAGYLHTNDPPQGEVAIRGPSVTEGYYKRDDLNNDETIFTKDGFLRTGDVGQWNKDGTLSLIDRIKNLIKLQGGEYIALERLESIYKSVSFIANICVHATTD
ncbi:hypothetical protein EWM64_g9924, partial [Hericium alpestre]